MGGAGNNPYGLRGQPDIDPFAPGGAGRSPGGFNVEKDGLGFAEDGDDFFKIYDD